MSHGPATACGGQRCVPPVIARCDKAYENIRDGMDSPLSTGREFTESLWGRYQGLEDQHFLRF
jgi:hypothetical protein